MDIKEKEKMYEKLTDSRKEMINTLLQKETKPDIQWFGSSKPEKICPKFDSCLFSVYYI